MSFRAIERSADLGVIELNETVGDKTAPKIHIAPDRHRDEVRSKPLRPPPPAFDPAPRAGEGPHDLGAEKLQTAVNKSTAQQQAAIDHHAIAANRGNSRPVEAHNLGYGIRKAELATYGAVDDPERPDLSRAIEVDGAVDIGPLDFQSTFVNSRRGIAAKGQKAHKVSSKMIVLRRSVGARAAE